MASPSVITLEFVEYPAGEMARRACELEREQVRRRSVRHFSDRPIPLEVVESCLRAAATAPSGANRQPWHFVVVTDPAVKRTLREAAEEEDRAFYDERAPEEWLDALAPLGTDANKPFLETAPCLIAIFSQPHLEAADQPRRKNYYVKESVGIATGFLVAALHHVGLATLTHTPSPMGFLNAICKRPDSERPYLILVIGYPAEGATVPAIARKPFEEVCSWIDGGSATGGEECR